MKIALLSTNYELGGAAIVTRRLCDALRALGHDARMIVARPGSAKVGSRSSCSPVEKTKPSCPPVEEPSCSSCSPVVVPKWQWLPAFLAERAELWFAGVRRKDIFKVSTGRFGVPIEKIPFVREADAVLVNWASQGFLSLGSLERLLDTGKHIVYTMHDLWPATAICHLPGSCRKFTSAYENEIRSDGIPGCFCSPCPYLSTKRGAKLIAEVAGRKRRIFSRPNLRLVAVSNWQRAQALSSAILSPAPVAVIPHPFPIDEYLPGEKLTPDGKRLIVMAAARLDDPVKDLPAAVEALNIFYRDYPRLAANTEVAFVGELRDREPLRLMELPYRLYGLLPPDELRRLYARASVVLSSSQYETMGATLMEGMACGAIPVTFGDAGQTDIVDDLRNGFVAPIHTPASLAFALSTAFEVINDQAVNGNNCAPEESKDDGCDENIPFSPAFLHSEVARRFSPEEIARRYLSLITETVQ